MSGSLGVESVLGLVISSGAGLESPGPAFFPVTAAGRAEVVAEVELDADASGMAAE
jgi:hypothetical protein